MQVYYHNILKKWHDLKCRVKKNFQWSFADSFSDCLRNIYTSVLENASSSEYSSDSDNVNMRPTKRPKKKKPLVMDSFFFPHPPRWLVMDSDTESEYEIHDAGEDKWDRCYSWKR